MYWIVHSLALLGEPLPTVPSRQAIVSFIAACQHPTGGFGGGPYQLPHLATTYAAVAALVTIGGEDAWSVVDRPKLLSFFLKMCVDGSFGGGMTMHEGGEVDVRGCYCALATCHMLGMDASPVADACALDQFVAACQSPEGGIGGEPGNEAHGGYTFCGYAALALAGRTSAIDVERLLAWAGRMQGTTEGGFMGRTNKLVDGCYSFWQGALFPLVNNALADAKLVEVSLFRDAKSAIKSALDALGPTKARNEEIQWDSERETNFLEFVKSLDAVGPQAAAANRVQAVQSRLDAAIEESLRMEERYQRARNEGHEDVENFKGDALDALHRAAEAQESFERAKENADAMPCSAQLLVHNDAVAACSIENNAGMGPRLLYDPVALQLWLLVACQGTHGGMRDKPGKHVDYYHTCYCLSGLSSAQHASQVVLGGRGNLLVPTDPLCNVVTEQLAAAKAYFLRKPPDNASSSS